MIATEASIEAVMFDFSGTLFRLEEDESWMAGLTDRAGEPFDVHRQAELMRRMTAPVGQPVEMDAEEHHAWTNRDLDPRWHREAYLTVLRQSGVATRDQALALYAKLIDPGCWTAYPDTAAVIEGLRAKDIAVAVLSNIAFDIRPAFAALGIDGLIDAFVLSFEVGAVKPDPAIFRHALTSLQVPAERTLMVGDSAEADGGARALGCGFALVEPLPTAQRPDGLIRALRERGVL